MIFLAIYTLIISTAQKFARGGEVTYYADCKPPDGFTSGTYSVSSLLPIEKCCPQTDPCSYIQGYCTLKWALELWPRMCDHMTYDCRDFQCVCCVKCSEDKCSSCTETRGECKKECRPDEVEDKSNTCSFPKCKCCKKCDIQPECQAAGGTCVGAYEDCPIGSFGSNTGCCGGCFCCKPACQPLPACSQVEGAYCSETEHCSGGYYGCHGLCQKTKWKGGYEAIEKCYCCIPKWSGAYVSVCPDDNDSSIDSTPGYKVPDKGSFGKPNWSATNLEIINITEPSNGESSYLAPLTTEGSFYTDQSSIDESSHTTQLTTSKSIKITLTTTRESINTTQSTLSSTELLAVDTTNTGGGDTYGTRDSNIKLPPKIPIRPIRNLAENVNKTEKVHITRKNKLEKVWDQKIIKDDSDKSNLVAGEGKTNKKDSVSNRLSLESKHDKDKNNEKNNSSLNGDGKLLKLNNDSSKNTPLQTDTQINGKATTMDQKDILEAIKLLKKLLPKKKAKKYDTNANHNEKKNPKKKIF